MPRFFTPSDNFDGSTVKMDKCTVSNNAAKESVTEEIIYADDSSLVITDTDFINNNTQPGIRLGMLMLGFGI